MKNKMKFSIARASQAEILRDSRKPFARAGRKHRSRKAYRREKKVDDCEK
jgi:hypothetical protein